MMIANFHAHRFVLAMSSLNQMSKAYLCQGTVLSTRFKQTGTYENLCLQEVNTNRVNMTM